MMLGVSVQGQVSSPLLSTGHRAEADWEKKLCDKAHKRCPATCSNSRSGELSVKTSGKLKLALTARKYFSVLIRIN